MKYPIKIASQWYFLCEAALFVNDWISLCKILSHLLWHLLIFYLSLQCQDMFVVHLPNNPSVIIHILRLVCIPKYLFLSCHRRTDAYARLLIQIHLADNRKMSVFLICYDIPETVSSQLSLQYIHCCIVILIILRITRAVKVYVIAFL